jgi:hypothetical protein
MSEAVAQYKTEVASLQEEVKRLKEQLLRVQQGGNVSTLEPLEAESREEDRLKIQSETRYICHGQLCVAIHSRYYDIMLNFFLFYLVIDYSLNGSTLAEMPANAT